MNQNIPVKFPTLVLLLSLALTKNVFADLDSYYHDLGYEFSPIHSNKNEGYTSKLEREHFSVELGKLNGPLNIAEVGFNTGHSAEVFLQSRNDTKVTSFDINTHSYTKLGVEYMKNAFDERFHFIPGDSLLTVPLYGVEHPEEKFDLIFIDGCHTFEYCLADIQNFQRLAHKDTILWIDDYDPITCAAVKNAVDHAEKNGLIQIDQVFNVTDESGPRAWVSAKYTFKSQAKTAFTKIYQSAAWGKDSEGNGTSGPGSIPNNAIPYLNFLADFLKTHNITSVVDFGCGDFQIGGSIDWGSTHYLGLDVVESVIKRNSEKYGSNSIQFQTLSGSYDTIPAADLLIVKDVLMHLPLSEVHHLVSQFKKFKYIITMHDVDRSGKNQNYEIEAGGFRPLSLKAYPFLLTPSESLYFDTCGVTKDILLFQNQTF